MAIYWKQNRFKAKAEDAYNEIMTLSEITADIILRKLSVFKEVRH